MEAKSKPRNLRVPQSDVQYVTLDGERIKTLPGNVPRMSGRRTAGDEEFLKSNNGKLARVL